MLAGIAKVKELAIDEVEAKALAEGAANVARHYNVAISQKTQDWANFIMALSMVYGTRMVAISKRISDEKRSRRAPAAVVDMDGNPVNPLNIPLNPTPTMQ